MSRGENESLHWTKAANYDVVLHVRADDSRGFEGESIIPLERMFALGVAEGAETGSRRLAGGATAYLDEFSFD